MAPIPPTNETDHSVTNDSLKDCSFGELTELCRSMARENVAPSIERLVELFPHLEQEIREKLPVMKLLDAAMVKDQAKASAVAPNQANIPKVVAGCILKEEIGRGGMGVVHLGHQPELNRDVAIKIIRLDADNCNQVRRFELERQALAMLDHPHVIPAYSFTQDRNHAYLIMKLIKGFGLNQLIAGDGGYKSRMFFNRLSTDWNCFASLGADIASGLQHAHDKGLIHRDIKPGNLLLDENGKIWISDFGLAKMAGLNREISKTGDMIGTPKYMAPEQIQGIADGRSDVYALGVTLYEIAAGRSARGDNWKPSQIVENSLPKFESIRRINPAVPEELAFVIMKACHFSPDDRYQSAGEMETVLRRFIDGCVPDRRRGKRKPDAVYRTEFRRKAILSIVGSILFGGGITYFLSAAPPTPEIEQEKNILELLAEKDELGQEVGKRLRDSIVKASEQLQLPPEEKQRLSNEANTIYKKIKTRELQRKDLNKLVENYRESNLGVATRIWRVVPVIQNSTMPAEEKESAKETLHRFAFVTAKKRLSKSESNRLVDSLTNGKPATAAEFAKLKFSTRALRTWVRRIHLATRSLIKRGEEINLSDEIRAIFPKEWEQNHSGDSESISPEQIDQLKEYEKQIRGSKNKSTKTTMPSGLTPEQIKRFKAGTKHSR